MDSYLYLFFHLLSHALLGASISYCLLPTDRWTNRIRSLALGCLSAISPDLLGGRDSQPWTHSLLFAPLVVIWIVLIFKLLPRRIPFLHLWGASIASAVGGHLFLDYMGHDVPLLYPFSDKPFIMEALTLGDPWVWLPLVAGLVVTICMKYRSKLPVILGISFVLIYCIYKVILQEVIHQKVQTRYPVSEPSYITVVPNTYAEFPLDPLVWLQFRFTILSSHHAQGGSAGFVGEKLGSQVYHYFHPQKREVVLLRGKYTVVLSNPSMKDQISIFVTQDKVENGYRYIEGTYENQAYLYKEIESGKWIEVPLH